MKKLITGLAILAASAAVAQDYPDVEANVVTLSAYCIDIETLRDLTDEYDELPLMRSTSVRDHGDVVQQNPLVIFANNKSGSFTIIEEISPMEFCVIAIGNSFRDVDDSVDRKSVV